MASSSRLEPQEKGKISVKVNVKGKSGNIKKTVQVYTNDPSMPVTALSLVMRVKDPTHSGKHTAQEIFSGQCRGCHVDKGKNKKGFELFHADCVMCHDVTKSASPLSEMSKRPEQYLRNAVRNGVHGSSMAGWATKNNGSLGDEEIDSIVDLIKKYEKIPAPPGVAIRKRGRMGPPLVFCFVSLSVMNVNYIMLPSRPCSYPNLRQELS